IRNAEVGVVQEIEELAAELQPGALGDREVLVHSEVPLLETGSTEGVATEIPEWRIGCRQRKGASRLADRRAEISGDVMSAVQRRQRTVKVRAKDRSAAVFGVGGKTGDIGAASRSVPHVQRDSGVREVDGVQFPSTDRRIESAARLSEEL